MGGAGRAGRSDGGGLVRRLRQTCCSWGSGGVVPEAAERAFGAVDGIGGWEGKGGHAGLGGEVGGGAADVPVLAGWIGADNEEVGGAGELAVAGAGGKKEDVAGAEGELAAGRQTFPGAAEDEAGFAAGKAEDFVGGGVEVVKGVDAVSPLRRPAIGGEEGLHAGGGVACGWHGGAVEQDGQAGVVGHPAVRMEQDGFGGGRGDRLGHGVQAAESGGEAGGGGKRGEAAAGVGGHA